MAITRRLKLTFKDNEGSNVQKNFNYVSSELQSNNVATLMDAMITNTSILDTTLVSKVKAELEVINTSDIEIE